MRVVGVGVHRGEEKSGGAILVRTLSWKLQPHYKWRHPGDAAIVNQALCAGAQRVALHVVAAATRKASRRGADLEPKESRGHPRLQRGRGWGMWGEDRLLARAECQSEGWRERRAGPVGAGPPLCGRAQRHFASTFFLINSLFHAPILSSSSAQLISLSAFLLPRPMCTRAQTDTGVRPHSCLPFPAL